MRKCPILVVDPVLPAWLPDAILRDLRLGGATATLRFHRDAPGETHVDVLEKRGRCTCCVSRPQSRSPPASGTASRRSWSACCRAE